jgi:hypothetical protein
MATFSRFNALDQILDIQGSSFHSATKTLSDEVSGFGQALTGQTGSGATIDSNGPVVTVGGLTGMTANSVGNFLTLADAATSANNGTFLIIAVAGPTEVSISNAAGVSGDSDVTWTERAAYSLNDDLNFQRTDRANIKGVAFDAAIPTYERPTAVGTPVPANLANIAGYTTDAQGFIINRKYNNVTVASTNTKVTLEGVGNFKHADAVDKTGVPVFDAPPYAGDFGACYVEVLRNDGTQLTVQGAGAHAGEKIFGVTNAGDTDSPDAVEVLFYSVPLGGDVSGDATPYTWEASQPTTVDLFYGYFSRLDQLSESALRTISSLGVEESGSLRQDVVDLWSAVGVTDGDTSLTLANTGNNFPFVELPVSPTVTAALDTLNAQIGDRTYTGSYLTSGETVAASLQALSSAVAAGNSIRYIERLGADIAANTAHTLPAGAQYTADGANNGRNLWVFTRGVLRDPGTVANFDDYAETSPTSITFFSRHRAGDHINYVVLG